MELKNARNLAKNGQKEEDLPPHKRAAQKSTAVPSSAPTEAVSSQPAPTSTRTRYSFNFSPSTDSLYSTETVSASRKKLSKALYTPLTRVLIMNLSMLEVDGLNEVLKSSVPCKECSVGPVVLMEDHSHEKRLCTNPSGNTHTHTSNVHAHTPTHTHTGRQQHTCTHTQAKHMHTDTHRDADTGTNTHTHKHTHKHTHTHTHTHTHSELP